MEVKPEIADKPEAVVLDSLRGAVAYEGVGFHYGDGEVVLEDVNLSVSPGETVALVGPTGAGKTTLVALLMRLYDVTNGRVTIDGHDVRDLAREPLVQQMSIVLQEPYLFSGTVKDNIRYSHVEATDEQVVAAAKARRRPRLHRRAGERIRHGASGAGLEPQRRPAPADQLRPRLGGRPAHPGAG